MDLSNPKPATRLLLSPREAALSPAMRILLAPRDAARALSICEKSLWSITSPRGPLPAVRIGRSVRYDVRDLEAFIARAKGGAA